MRLSNGDVLFAWPLAQHILTAGYYYSDGSLHQAIDLRAAVGTPVFAAESGVVDWVQTWDGKTKTGAQSYGTGVRIQHAGYAGKSLQTRYAHLDKLCVTLGQQVQEGQIIGYSGNTGNSTGPHLHFEVIWGGTRRNPLVWLDDDFATANASVYTYGAGQCAVVRPDGSATATPAAPAAPCEDVWATNGPWRIAGATGSDKARLQALCQELALKVQTC